MVIWYFYGDLVFLWSFVFYVNLIYFYPFGILYQEKSGNPDLEVDYAKQKAD
jgi:hypothetical protein